MTGEDIRIDIPDNAKRILSTLAKAGFEGYVVGGCVRDSILGRRPQDWDITTNASPEQVKALFRRTVDTGIQHGTVTVMMDREGYEVTTYRIDGEYEDARHPKEVIFTKSLREDLRRRDFTINAMAYNDEAGLVDLFEGLEDIRTGTIRCVGEALERFSEDALRILRAVRFSAQLGYGIEEKTREGIRLIAPNLSKISAERIRTELEKLLVSPHPEYLKEAYELGITAVVLPEFDRCMETQQNHPHHCYSVGEHILQSVMAVPAKKELRLAMLFHDIGKPETLFTDEEGITHFYGHPEVSERMTHEILRRLRFDNDTISVVCRLVRYHDYATGNPPTMKKTRRAIHLIGEDVFEKLFYVWRADVLAQSTYMREEKLENQKGWKESYELVKKQEQCVSLRTLKINGSDLIRLGMKPGREIGAVLQALLDDVLETPEHNEETYLADRAKQLAGLE